MSMIDYVNTHGVAMLFYYYVFAAVSGGMPTPPPTAGLMYQWAFRTVNILNASLARMVATQFPNSATGKALQGPATPPEGQ